MRPTRPVSEYMTTFPISIDSGAALREADSLMTLNGFRHLPVLRDGEPIGILSDRDVKLARSLPGVNLEVTRVEDIAKSELYAVGPETPLDLVARTMSERRIDSAVIIEQRKVVGIFTTTDALRALSDLAAD